MACIDCKNCKQGDLAYFCFDKNELVVMENIEDEVVEKSRGGWKKGDKEYEMQRRKSRNKVEA